MVRETRYLIVRNLPENCTEETVIDHFQRYGKIQSVKLQAAKDNDSGSTATVAFNDIKSAAKAHHAKNNLGEVTLRTDYWEGSTGTPVIATPPVTTANAVRSNYTNVSAAPSKPVTTFTNWKKGTEDDSSANQDKGISTSVQVSGVNTPITVSSALEKLSTTPSFDPSSRGRPRERLPKKKFGKFEKNGSFGRHGPSSRSLEAVRSQSEAAAAAAAALAASSASLATTSAVTGSGTTGSSGTTGLNPIIVNDIKDINSNKDNKEVSRDNSLSKSALSPCSRNSGLKKSQSNSRSASRSRSRSLCSKSSSSRSDSSGTSTSNSPHKSVPKSMIGASKLVSSETKKDENDGERRPLGICVTGLPLRSTDSSLRDGLYHEYKKHGKVTSVQICLEGETRCAIVSFRKPEDASKALEASQGKVFFGAKIKVTSHEGVEVDDSDGTNDNDSLDEYHPKSTRTLFVGNLEKETTKEDLIEKFKRFGEIIDVDVKRQGATTAFAFVQYVDIASVVAALRGMEGEHIGINKIKLGFGKSMPTFCVWVDNLPGDIVSRTLKTAMARYGEITYCLIDKTRSRGLIYFTSYDDAQHCVSDIKMRPHLMKKKLQIDFASRECQSNFLDRMEETGQLRANERPDEARSHNKFRQRSFENTTEEGSPSSYAYSRTTVGYPPRRRGRQYDATFPEESHQSSRRSRRPEDFSSQSSVYFSGKSSNDDYVAELREYEISKRERRDRDISPRHSSTGRVDSHSRRGSRDHSLDRYEDRQKERTGEAFNSREISPSSEHNSFHSENRYRPRDDKYTNRDRYEDVKVDDKDFDRHSRPSRTTSPFLQNHTGLHEGDFRRVGSRSQSPPTPLQEDAPRFYVNDDYESSYSRRRDSEDLSKSKPWSTLSTKLGAEVIKTVENRKRTYEQAGLSDSKLVKKPEKSSTLSENKLKNNHRQLDISNRRRMKGIDHPSSPGSSGSHIDSENGSVSEGDLHHLHQEKQHILKELKECEAEVVDASESDSPLSVARIKSIAVKDNLKSFGRSLEEKRIDELSFRRQEEKHRRSDLKPWIHLSDDLSSPRDNNKHLLGGKDEFIGDNSDSDIELNIKKRRTEFHGDSDLSDEDILDSCSEQNSRIANFPCDSKISSLNSKLFESNKSTDVSSSCDNGNLLKGGLSDKDLSVIKPYSTSSISNAWNMSVSALESSPQGDFSSAYSDENTQDSVTSGSLSGKSFKLSPPGSPLDKDCSGSEFSYTKYVVPDIIAEDSFSDDSLSDNQHAPNAKDLEERLRYIDEFLNGTTSKASDLTLSSSFTNERLRKSGLDGGTLSEKRQEPSVIMQQVLAKKSILDQDIIRLKCNDKKDHTSEMSFPFKSSDWGNKPLLFSSLSHPVTTSSSMLQPTITTSVVSSAYMTAPISTSVLTLSIVSASIASSINISKTAAVDSLHLSRLSESSSKSGVFSEKLPVSTNLLTLEPDVSVCSNSLSSKSVCGLVPCSSMDTVVDSNLLTCPSVGKPVSSTSLSPSLSFLQPLSSTLSSSNSSHLKNTLPQIVPSSSPVTLCSSSSLPLSSSSSSSLLSSVNKSPMGANVAAPFTQGPDKSQLTPTVGQEAPHLCSPSFTPENSRTSSNSHLPGNRSPRIVTPKQKDDQHISSNKHELTVNISRSEDETKSQVTAAKTELVTPDIESPVSVKSETSSNSSVPLSSLDTKANCALEDKTLPSSHYLGIQTSSSENNNVVVIKSQISSIVDSKSASCIISTENTLDKASSYDGLDSSNNTKNLKNVDVTDWPSKKTEISLPVSCTTVFGVSTKDNSDKKELSSPSDSTSKGKPSSSLPLNNDIVNKSLSNAPSTSAVSLLKQVTEKTDKKTVKPSSHAHSKSPAKSEALFAPDVKVEQLKSEKSEIKHHSKDSHKTSSSNKSNSSIEKKVSKTSKDGPGSKDSEKVDRKTDSSHKSSGHESSKTKESDKSKAKDRKDVEKNKQKDKEDSKKKEEKKVSSDKKDELKVKEDKKIEKKLDDKKEKPEKEKSKEIIKQSMVKKSKPESADLNKKEKKHKSKEVSSKEKVGDKKVLPVLKNTHSEVKSKEMSKSDSKLNKNDHLKSEPTKNDEKNKTESKHKIDTKTVTKNDSKSDSHVASKKHATESSRSKKEADKETSKYISQKLKQRDDKSKEKQKVKEDKEKPKEEKEKLKAEKDEELEKQKEKKELEEKKEKEERLKREKEERELQKEKEEKERKDKEEKIRREKEEREKEKAQKEKERIERERHEKERKEKEDRDRQHEKERQKEERERKEKEERERKEKEERERKEKEREERERKEREERERKEKEREERERKEKEERERKEREKEERERKEKEREDRERKEKEDRERKEKEERERKEKEERERKEKEDRERKEKEKEEKERKEKEKEEKERKDKEKEEKERKERERREREKKEKKEKERKAKEEKLRKEKEDKVKKEKEEKAKKDREEKAKKDERERSKKEKEKKEKEKKEDKDDDDKDEKDMKKPPPKKPKRNELAVLLDSNDRFQMTFTSMYDRVKTQRNREPEQHKPEPAPKSSFDKFKQNRKKKGNKAKSSLYSCGSNSDLSDDSDLSESESSQKAEPVKETKPKKTSQIKKRPHVSSSSSSSCEEDDDALLRASKPKGKKADKFSNIFSSDSEDSFPTPKASSKSKSKPIPKRRKTREDSTDSMNSRDEFLKPHVLTTTDQDSLDDIDFSDEDDIPKLSSKKKIKTKKADKSGDNEKRESSVESVNKKVTKLERESSIESLSKKLHKSDKDETPSKKLKTENKSEKHEPDTERKSSAKDDSKKILEDKKKVKEPVKESSKDKKERKETEPKLGTVMKTESKKDVESKKDSEAKKEVESKKEVEVKKDAEVKIETEKTKVKDKTFDDLSVKNVEDRKKKKDKDDGPVKKKKKKKLDPKAEEERVNSLINKVYDSTNLDKDRKQKKRPKPSIFDSDSDMATSETSVEVTKTTAVEDNKVHKTDTDISKPKEKIIESSKDKEVLKEKSLKHVKDCKSSTETSKKSESKKKKVTQMDTESEKSSLTESLGKKEKPDITLEKKNQVKSDETTGKPPKKKKKKREHDKDNDKEKLKSPKVAKGDEKINAEKKNTELEKKQASSSDDASNNEPAQVVDEFVSFWGHPKPALIPRRLKDTTKVDDDKKPKEKEDGKTEEKADSVMVSKDVIKEEKTSIEKQDEQLISDRTVKVELESNEEIPVPISEAETTVTTELAQIASLDTPATTGTGHQTDIGSMNEDVTGVKDETTIGSSVEIHEDDEYPSLVIDELSETVSDEKKKFTKQEKKLLKQQQEEKERNDRIDEVIASVAGGSDIVDDLAVKEKESSQMDSASNDRELDLSDVINLKCEAKFSNENKSIIVSDLLFPDKEKAPEQTLQFGAFRKDKKEPKPINTTSSKVEEEKTQLISSLAKKDDLKIEDEMVKHLPPTDSVSEKPAISEEQKPTEEELKKKLEEEMKKKQEEEEERKAEEERKKVEEEKARQEKEQQAIREASDEAARAVESLFQSGFTQDSLDMDDDLPPLFIESAEDPPTEVATPSSPAKDKIETDAFFTNSIPEKLTANLDDKLLEETKLLVKGDEADHKIDALNFFAPPQQAVTPGFTSPRRNSTVQDKIPEPAAPIPSPQLQMQSPQRQIPPSPLIQSPQRQISPQRQMQSPQRQLTSPQQIQSPQRPPLQSPLRPLQSPQINLQSPLHSPPFCNKDRSLMSPNREVFVVQDLESSLVQQTQRRASSGLPVSTAEQAIDSFRRKSQEFPAEQMFHSPRRNTISVPEEATSTHLDHRFQHHQGASVIYSKKSPHSHSSLPPPVSISLDNAPHDRNFQTPMRNLNITPQECNLLSPTKKVSPSFHFKDIPADPSLFQTACNKNALQDSLFPSHKSLFNDSMFSHHQKHPAQEQIFHTNKPQIHDILKTSAPPPPPSEQHVFFKGNVTEKPLIAKLTESNFPFSKNTLQDQLFPQVTQVKIPQLPLDRMPQEPLFSPKGHLDASYNYNEPVDFLLHSPPRNQEFLNYSSNPEAQKPLVKPTETIDLFNKDPFHHADTRHNEKVDPSQPRRMEGFPASYYQEPIPGGSLPKFSDNTVIQQQQQSLFDDDKKNKKRKRNNKRNTKEDKAAALAEQQAIEQSVQANVESIHKALTASQAKAAAEKAGTNAEKKKSIDAYDFEAHTGQEMVSQNIISGMDHTNFNDDQRLTRSRSDSRGRRRGSVARRGKNGRGGMTSMMDPQDSLLEPLPLQQQPALSQQNPFAVHSHDQVAGQSQTKHGYNPYQFPSQQQQPPLPSFQRQNSQPVGQSFYPSPQSSSDNSSVSLPDWQMKQTVLPQQQSHIVVQPTHQPPHNIPHPQQTQQHQPLVKLPLKPDDRSPETNKLDLDSSFGESELVINLDDQPSSIEGKENHNSFSSDGEAPSPATPKAQRPTRARKQTNYKAIASGTINVPPQARTSRSGGSPRGRLTGGQSPKNNMSPRASSSENVQPSAVVKLEKLEVTRATRRRKGPSKEEVGEDSVNSSFEDWKTKKGDDKKVVPKDNVYEFVDNEQEQSIEPNIRTRARKKRASDNQEVGQSQPGVDYLIGSPPPPPTVNPSLAADKGGYEPVEPPRSSDDLPKPAPLSNVDAVIDAVSKGIFGSNEEEYIQNIPSSTPPETASPPSPVHLPPTTRLTRRSTEAKKEAEQKDVKFTIEPSKSDSRDLGKKGPTVPPLRIKVAHGTPKVEKKEEKHYVIERASKNIGVTVDHSEKPPLAFTVKLSDTGTATIKPSVTAGHFNPSLSVMGKNSVQEGIKYGDGNLKKDNNLGLFSGLPQNEQQQQTVEHELPKSVTSQVPPWKPIDSVAMDSQVTRPSGALHPKVAAKIQLSQESLNNSSSLSSLVQNSMPQTTQLSNLPPSTSALASQSKSSPSPVHAGHVWNSNIQSANLNQPSPNSHLPLNLQNSSVPKDAALLLQRPPSAHDLINKHPPSAHIQTTTRPDRAVKGGAKIGLDVNQEMATKINLDTSQKHPEPSFAYTGPVPPAHIGQRPFMISPDQQSIPTSHHNLHFPNNAFKANLEVRNSKSPSIPPQSSLKLGSDLGTRTPPVTSGAMLYAGIVAAQPISLSPTSASPEGQVIERLPNPIRPQGDSGCQSPLNRRMHPEPSRFLKDDLESSLPSSVHGDQNPSREMIYLMEQRLHQHLLLVQENSRNPSQDQSRNAEVARNMRIAHDQSRNTPVGLDNVRKNSLTTQPVGLNQPLNLADSDVRADPSRGTPKSTPPASQSPFSLPYLDRKVESGRMQVGVTSAFMQPSPGGARETLSHMYPDLPLGLDAQFGMVGRLSLASHIYASGHPPQHLLRDSVLPGHFPGFPPGSRFSGLEQYSDKKGEPGHPDQVASRGMMGSPSPNPMLSRPADILLMKSQQPSRMPIDLPTNSPVGILQRYPVMWQGALALKNDNSYVQMHFIAGNRRLPNQALPQPMPNGALPPLRISQRMRLEQAQLEGVSKRMQCEDDYCILIAVACGRDQSDISIQTRALNEGFITYLLSKQAAGIVNVPLPGSEQAGFVVHIFPPCEFVDNSVAEQGSLALMEQLREVPHAVIIIATT